MSATGHDDTLRPALLRARWLSVMMLLQFFVWGARGRMGRNPLQGLKFSGFQTAQAYSTMPWARSWRLSWDGC